MNASIRIIAIVVAFALAGCQVTVDDERISGSLGSGQTSEEKAKPATNPGASNSSDNSSHNRPDGDNGSEPEPTNPEPTEPAPTEPEPTEPEPTEPEPTNPEPTEPTHPSDPEPTEPSVISVSLYWSAPMERVNGDSMDFEEIGGYEIRYRKLNEEAYTKVVINDPLVEQFHIDDLEEGDYLFEVAVFDTSGLYSDFIVAQ